MGLSPYLHYLSEVVANAKTYDSTSKNPLYIISYQRNVVIYYDNRNYALVVIYL